MILEYCSHCGVRLGLAAPCVCAACGREHWANPKPCGAAFVSSPDGRLLLVLRENEPWADHWDVPGGFCDGAEHPEATTLREVREETGLEIRLTGLLGMWIDSYDDLTPTTLNIYFTAETDDPGAAGARDEVSAVRWFAPGELVDLPLAFPDHARTAVDTWIARQAGVAQSDAS